MRLREIASNKYSVLALDQPADGVPVLSLLEDAKRNHIGLHDQMLAMLAKIAPTFDPPLGIARPGIAGEKELLDGLFEFLALGGAGSRRQRAKQSKEERMLGLRVFFFRYGGLIVCTNGCYKAKLTPADAIPAALANKEACLKSLRDNSYDIIQLGD